MHSQSPTGLGGLLKSVSNAEDDSMRQSTKPTQKPICPNQKKTGSWAEEAIINKKRHALAAFSENAMHVLVGTKTNSNNN
eukprot:5758577-Amphidinium_carterae.1